MKAPPPPPPPRGLWDPLFTSFLFGAAGLLCPAGAWERPALVVLMGLSVLNHATHRAPPGGVLSVPETAVVQWLDRTLAHGIALGTVAEAVIQPPSWELTTYWACLAWTGGVYYLRSLPLGQAGDGRWRGWHASMHVASCAGMLFLQAAKGVRLGGFCLL